MGRARKNTDETQISSSQDFQSSEGGFEQRGENEHPSVYSLPTTMRALTTKTVSNISN